MSTITEPVHAAYYQFRISMESVESQIAMIFGHLAKNIDMIRTVDGILRDVFYGELANTNYPSNLLLVENDHVLVLNQPLPEQAFQEMKEYMPFFTTVAYTVLDIINAHVLSFAGGAGMHPYECLYSYKGPEKKLMLYVPQSAAFDLPEMMALDARAVIIECAATLPEVLRSYLLKPRA